jgi:TolB-like protein/DNA-binding winged helix-turn-helix (wHTH) protein/cytochrome c-type biogenesis protein CcmH/NrfG
MTIPEADPPTPMRARRLRFDRFVLDLDRGCLLLGGNEIALRPKTFGVLRHLVENAGILVSKEELFAAVWPNLVITDDALVQSIGELRRALGDDGSRLIRTIPRRGYRFEPEVSVLTATGESAPEAPPVAPEPQGAARWRLGWLALALAVLLAAAALWVGTGDRFAIRSPEPGAKPAIAVLPFVDHSDEPGREYFADGLTQDIINALGRFSALTVVSWNAVFPYKNKAMSPEKVGRGLAVAYVVEGSVRRIGEQVRVSAQLVDTRRGQVLWSARFDEALADVFALQDRITSEIVGALAIRVTQIEQRRVFAKPTASLEAYDYVLRARPALLRPTRAEIAEARALLRRAIELDPGYAAAHAALSETYYIATSMGWAESPTAFMDRAEESALRALALDNAEVRARVILGRIHIFHQRYKEAEAEIERAIAINPNDARSLAGRGNILVWLGRTDAAIEALERARRIDPDLSPIDRFALGLAYYLKRRYDAAIEQAELNLRGTAGASFSRVVLAAAYAQLGRAGDAARAAAEVRRTDPTFDPEEFGTKFLSPADLEHLRDGMRKAGLRDKTASPG